MTKLYMDMTNEEKLLDQLIELHRLRQEAEGIGYNIRTRERCITELVRNGTQHSAVSLTRPAPQVIIANDLFGFGIPEIDETIPEDCI